MLSFCDQRLSSGGDTSPAATAAANALATRRPAWFGSAFRSRCSPASLLMAILRRIASYWRWHMSLTTDGNRYPKRPLVSLLNRCCGQRNSLHGRRIDG